MRLYNQVKLYRAVEMYKGQEEVKQRCDIKLSPTDDKHMSIWQRTTGDNIGHTSVPIKGKGRKVLIPSHPSLLD